MHAKITTRLVASLSPQAAPYEVTDTELMGFRSRVQPGGMPAKKRAHEPWTAPCPGVACPLSGWIALRLMFFGPHAPDAQTSRWSNFFHYFKRLERSPKRATSLIRQHALV